MIFLISYIVELVILMIIFTILNWKKVAFILRKSIVNEIDEYRKKLDELKTKLKKI